MKPFLDDDFLLNSPTSRRLYHEVAAKQPIIDYHNHLPPADIADNRQFSNLYEAWLEGDHYKWRAMRCAGVNVIHGGKNTLRFTPWFGVTSQEIDIVVDVLRQALVQGRGAEKKKKQEQSDAGSTYPTWHPRGQLGRLCQPVD